MVGLVGVVLAWLLSLVYLLGVLFIYMWVLFLVFCGVGFMARLVATVGTSPGVVYEALLNVCRGLYDAPYSPAVPVDTVVMVHTSAPGVVRAARIARLLIHCSHAVFPEGDPRRLPCRVASTGLAPVGAVDIDSRRAYELYHGAVSRHIGPGDVVDVTGGRASMAVAAARAAIGQPGTMVTTTIVPQDAYQAAMAALNVLRNYDLDTVMERALSEGCGVLGKYPGLAEALGRLVTGRARTILLYP